MTNLERIKQLSAKEFTEWIFQFEQEARKLTPIWCGGNCEDVDCNCKVCIAKWLNEEVKE